MSTTHSGTETAAGEARLPTGKSHVDNSAPAPFHAEPGLVIYQGDCRDILRRLHVAELADVAIVDPPYGDTSLAWDAVAEGWVEVVLSHLKREGTVWCFGSMKFFLLHGHEFTKAGLVYVQDIVWEKHNGSSFHADRFKRVHEIAVQFRRADVQWAEVYKSVQTTLDAIARRTIRRKRPAHTGHVDAGAFQSEMGGPRLERSVQFEPSCHGHAEHPTQKPERIVKLLMDYSCPPAGLVIDPFLGSGTTLRVAKDTGRRGIGIERDAAYCAVAKRRLSQGVLFAGVGQ